MANATVLSRGISRHFLNWLLFLGGWFLLAISPSTALLWLGSPSSVGEFFLHLGRAAGTTTAGFYAMFVLPLIPAAVLFTRKSWVLGAILVLITGVAFGISLLLFAAIAGAIAGA
jgi:hypothetical protein